MRTTINNKGMDIRWKKAARIFLLALAGYGIALFGQIPGARFSSLYPIDLSDVRLLFTYALYGFFPSFFVLVFKNAMVSLTFFSTLCLPFPVYPIRITINSLFRLLSLFFFDRFHRFFSSFFPLRFLAYLLLLALVSSSCGYFSFLFLLPSSLKGCFSSVYCSSMPKIEERRTISSFFFFSDSYAVSSFCYGLFYGLICEGSSLFLYEILLNPLIFKIRKSPANTSKVFLTKRERSHFSPFDSILSIAIKEGEDKRKRQRIINKRRVKDIKDDAPVEKDINENRYEYQLSIDEFGVSRKITLSSLVHSSALILAYLKNIYPKQSYKILSYQYLGDSYVDASTDGLSKDVFRKLHHCDKITTSSYSVTIRIR